MARDLGSELPGEPVEGLVVIREGDDIAEVADRLHTKLDASFTALRLALEEIDRLADGGLRIDPRNAISRGGVGTASMRSAGIPRLYSFANEQLASEPLALHASAAGAFGGRGEGSLLRVPHLAVLGDIQSAFGISAAAQGLSDLMLARSWGVTRPLDEVQDLLSRDADVLWKTFALDPEAWHRLRATFVLVRSRGAFLPGRIDVGDVHDAAHGRFIVEVAPLDSEMPIWLPLADLVAARLRSPVDSIDVVDTLRVVPGGRRVLNRVRGAGGTWFDPEHDDFFAWTMLDRQAANDEADTREPGSPEEAVWRARARFARNTTNTVSFGQPLRVDLDVLPKGTPATIPFLDGEDIVEAQLAHLEKAGPDFCPVISSSTTAGCRLLVGLLQHEWERRGGTVSAIHTDSLLVVSSPEDGEVSLPDSSSICSLPWSDARETFESLDSLLPAGVRGPLAKAKHGTLDEPTEAVVVACNRYVLRRGEDLVHTSEHGLGNLAVPDDGCRVLGAGHRVWIDKALKALYAGAVNDLVFADAPSVSRFRITSPEQASWFAHGVRPFNLAFAAHPDVLGHLTQSAGPVALEDLTKGSGDRLSLDWYRRGGRPVKLGVRGSTDDFELTSTVFAQSIGWFLRRWWATAERGSELVAGTADGPVRGLVRRKPLTVVALGYVGREGSSIDRRRRLASVEGDDPVLLSIGKCDDRWPIMLDAVRELRRLKPDGLARIVPGATLRYILAGRQPSSEHRNRIVALLASEARRYLTVAGVPLPESPIGTLVAFTAATRGGRDCLGCGQPFPPNARPNRRLCDGCRRFGPPPNGLRSPVSAGREGRAMTEGRWQLLPPLSDEEYRALKADIAAQGVLVPVVIDADSGETVEGHHRLRAWTELRAEGVKMPPYPREVRRFASDDERISFVVAANLFRRHLSCDQRVDLVARLRSEGWSLRRIGDAVGVEEITVRRDLEGATYVAPERIEGADRKSYPVRCPSIVVDSDRDQSRATEALRILGDDAPTKLLSLGAAEERARDASFARLRAVTVPPRIECPAYELRLGDLREVWADVPDDSIDCLVVDPPYDEAGIPLFEDLARLALRVLKPGRLAAVYCGHLHLDTEIELLAKGGLTYVWHGVNLLPGRHTQIHSLMINGRHRSALLFSAGPYRPRRWVHDAYFAEGRGGPEERPDHKWQQAVEPVRHWIHQVSESGEVVFDPTCGSGTTGVAALMEGRRFLGGDLDPAYVETTRQRLEVLTARAENDEAGA